MNNTPHATYELEAPVAVYDSMGIERPGRGRDICITLTRSDALCLAMILRDADPEKYDATKLLQALRGVMTTGMMSEEKEKEKGP